MQLSFLANDTIASTVPFDVPVKIPTWFWYSKAVYLLPLDLKYRRQICMEVINSNPLTCRGEPQRSIVIFSGNSLMKDTQIEKIKIAK